MKAKITKYIISDWQESKKVYLAKSFRLSKDNKIIKGQPGIIFDGKAVMAEVDLAGLRDGISRLTKKSCIGLGNCGQKKVQITTVKNDGKKGKLARTKKNFCYHLNEPAFVYFDMDHVAESPNHALEILESVVPGLDEAGKLIIYSSSSGVKNKKTGELLSDSTSAHIYIMIQDGSDAIRFIDTVFDRLALSGHGAIEISKAPSCLKRGLIDKAVSGPERLVYESRPILGNGIVQNRPEPLLVDGGALDSSLTKSLTTAEEIELKKVWTCLIDNAMPEMMAQAKNKAQKIAKNQKITLDEAEKIVSNHQKGKLDKQLILHFKDHGEITVDEAIKKGRELHYAQLADPIDPDYDGGSLTKAKFFWNDGNPVIHSQAHGGINYTFAGENDGGGDNDENDGEGYYPTKTIEELNKLNDKYSAVILGSKFRIIREGFDKLAHRHMIDFLQLDAFKNFFANKKVAVRIGDNKEIKYKPLSQVWMEWEGRKTFSDVVFAPGNNIQSDQYNMFRGFPIKPKKGECKLILDHIKNVICDGVEEYYKYMISWMAKIVQEPGGKRPGVAVVLMGGKGIGKGAFVNYFGKIFGEAFLPIADSDNFTGRFNMHLSKALLVFLDEAMWAGDKKAEGKLKSLITEPTILFEPKGIDSLAMKNYLYVMIASNEDWVVPATGDERRFFALNVNNNYQGDRDYFNALYNERDNGGVAALMQYLFDYTIDIDLRAAPHTDALSEQVQVSFSPVEKFWHNVIARGYLLSWADSGKPKEAEGAEECTDKTWPDYAYKYECYKEYEIFCKNHGMKNYENERWFWRRSYPMWPVDKNKIKIKREGTTGPRKLEIPRIDEFAMSFRAETGVSVFDDIREGDDDEVPF